MEKLFTNPLTVVIVMIFAVPVIAIISYYVYAIFKTRSTNALKQSMVERGMSVPDIEAVINAGTKSGRKRQ